MDTWVCKSGVFSPIFVDSGRKLQFLFVATAHPNIILGQIYKHTHTYAHTHANKHVHKPTIGTDYIHTQTQTHTHTRNLCGKKLNKKQPENSHSFPALFSTLVYQSRGSASAL